MSLGHYTLIDLPVYTQPEWYEVAVNGVCSALMNHGKIKSVYRIGSVSAPGISDLDMVVIFKDNTSTAYNPLGKLVNQSKYLFVHPLFGACESHFLEVAKLTHFHNYRLIGGEDIFPADKVSAEDDKIIRRQTALEFMVKMLFVMTTQRTYKIIKVRSFLLEARALEYDLQFLGMSSGPLFAQVQAIIELRKKWFLDPQVQKELEPIFENLYTLLKDFVSAELQKAPMYTPGLENGKFARNVRWSASPKLELSSRGFPMPSFPANFFRRKYYNLENRLTSFSIKLPVNPVCPEIILRRFELNRAMTEYNKKNIPNFMPLASSLRLI